MDNNTVTWLDIPGYEGLYQINQNAEIKALARTLPSGRGNSIRLVPEKQLRTFTDKKGQVKIQLFKDKKKRTLNVKKLMRIVFGGQTNEIN